MTAPQHGQHSPGSARSVTFRMNSTSTTCAHRGSTVPVPSSGARQDRHSAGGASSFFSPGSGSRRSGGEFCFVYQGTLTLLFGFEKYDLNLWFRELNNTTI